MKFAKNIIKKNFSSFVYFYRYLGYRLFVVVALSIAIGALDAFGLTMFLPLLQLADGGSNVDLGNLSFITDFLASKGIELTIYKVLFFLLFVFLIKGIVVYIASIYKHLVQQELSRKIRVELIRNMSRYRYDYFVKVDIGRIQNIFIGEIGRLNSTYVNYISMLQGIIMVLVYLFFSFLVDSKFAILICFGGWLSNFIFSRINKLTEIRSKNISIVGNEYARLISQYINNFKYLKASGYVYRYEKFVEKGIENTQYETYQLGKLRAIITSFREPVLVTVVCIVIIIQILFFGSRISELMISLLFLYRALMYITNVQNSYNNMIANQGAIDNILTFNDELKEHKQIDGTVTLEKFNESLTIKELNFFYGTNQVLKNISLEIPKNTSIGLIGESGSGKTTLVNIIAKLLLVEKEKYFVDQTDSTDIITETLQEKIGYISQEPSLFNDSIFNNITFWAAKTPENINKVNSILKKTLLYDFVYSHDDQLDYRVENNGQNLSGGQRQRIAIARELFKNAVILILDEATSALDTQTETEIKETIDRLTGEITIIIIAHRLSTIKNTDYIYLLSSGEIQAEGNFNFLYDSSSEFKKMVDSQNLI